MQKYDVVRFYEDGGRGHGVIQLYDVTLEEAQKHCNDPETSSSTKSGYKGKRKWFDGYRLHT